MQVIWLKMSKGALLSRVKRPTQKIPTNIDQECRQKYQGMTKFP